MNIGPDYLASTLRRIETRNATPTAPKKKPKPATEWVIVGYYGTVSSVLGVDRRRKHNDPHAVDVAIGTIVADYIEPEKNEVEDATIGNEEILRGIPCCGRVSGTIRGTDPLREIMRYTGRR